MSENIVSAKQRPLFEDWQNRKYQTIDGDLVRVLCIDRKHSLYPVVFLVVTDDDDDDSDNICTVTLNGYHSTTDKQPYVVEVSPEWQGEIWVKDGSPITRSVLISEPKSEDTLRAWIADGWRKIVVKEHKQQSA